MNKETVYSCAVVQLQKIEDRSGNIAVIENSDCIPFDIRRVFYLYDIPGGKDRGAHAHKKCHQFLIAASGSFEIELDDGLIKRTIVLNRSYYGLHIPPGIWACEKGFSSGAICLVLASHRYDADDYIRDYDSFLKFKNNLSN